MQLFFGPNLRYFFHDGKGNYRYRAPPDFVDFFKKTTVTTIHHVAFGIGDSFYLSYTDTKGLTGAWFDLDDHYPKLRAWLLTDGHSHDFAQVYVSLGLNGAFWASSNVGHRWSKLPEAAQEYYQRFTSPNLFLTKRVSSVDLGFNDTFCGISIDNTWFWDLGSQYPTFVSLNPAKELPKAQFVIINAFAPDQHFAVFKDGSTHYSLPQEWAGDIAALFQQYASQTVQSAYPQAPPLYVQPSLQPQPQPPQQQKNRWWKPNSSSNSTTAYQQPPAFTPAQFYTPQPQLYQSQAVQPAQQQQQPSTVNEALHLGNNVLDAYNNMTNASSGQSNGGGGGFDINQAMSTMQSSVDTLNNVTGAAGQGMNLINQIAGNGLMVGQVAGQFVGAAAGCAVM